MQHFITTANLSQPFLDNICELAFEFELLDKQNNLPKPLLGKIVASLFYEPSTRTRLSFEAAALKLGANVISTENAGQFSSAAKGETLDDTIKIINGYANAIILRHHEAGSAQKAASVSKVPVVNAGDGIGEHPTQALLDYWTIQREFKHLNRKKIAMVGDLKNGRTVHSLTNILANQQEAEFFFVSPKSLRMPEYLRTYLRDKKVKLKELESWDTILPLIDVLYMTRVQKERFSKIEQYDKYKDSYIIDQNCLAKLSPNTIIMHPLPRTTEIPCEVDNDPRARYFQQAQNGLYIRMALLTTLIK